jgi:hypothetical protein
MTVFGMMGLGAWCWEKNSKQQQQQQQKQASHLLLI